MIFTEFEKRIINTIAAQDLNTIHPFGYTGREILFPKNEGAIFIPKDVLIGNEYHSVLFLLALHDGGRFHAVMRERVVAFVSLMKYLEDNRLVYIMDGPINKPCLYYSGYQHTHIENSSVSSKQKGMITINDYQVNIEENIEFKYQSIVRDGYIRHYDNVQLHILPDTYMGAIEFGGNIKNDLYRYVNAFIYPTITLTEMISHDFKTESERLAEASLYAAKEQVKKAQQTLIIAIITLISSIAIPILSCAIPDSHSSIIKILCMVFCALLLMVCGAQIAIGNIESD